MAAEPAEEREIKKEFHIAAKAFGILAKAIRTFRAINQEDLEKLSNIKRTAISAIENGRRNVQLDTVVKYAYGLKVRILDLVADTGITYPKFVFGENTPVPFADLSSENQEALVQETKNAFGIRLKDIREARQISQDRLDVLCGVTKGDISKIENGKKNIELYRLIRFSYGLKVPLEDFFTEILKSYESFPTLENITRKQEINEADKKTVKKKAAARKKSTPAEKPAPKGNITGNKKPALRKKAAAPKVTKAKSVASGRKAAVKKAASPSKVPAKKVAGNKKAAPKKKPSLTQKKPGKKSGSKV